MNAFFPSKHKGKISFFYIFPQKQNYFGVKLIYIQGFYFLIKIQKYVRDDLKHFLLSCHPFLRKLSEFLTHLYLVYLISTLSCRLYHSYILSVNQVVQSMSYCCKYVFVRHNFLRILFYIEEPVTAPYFLVVKRIKNKKTTYSIFFP